MADAYNAMTSDRPYRDAMPSRVARLRLAQAVESQFDTTVVAAFEAVLAGASEAYRSGQREDFSLEAKRAQNSSARGNGLVVISDSGDRLGSGTRAHLREYVMHMDLHGRLGDPERSCDFAICEPLRNEVQDFAFASCQRLF